MFNKKIKLVLIILVFMLSLGVISASDSNLTDDGEISDIDEEPPSASINNLSANETLSTSFDNQNHGESYHKDLNLSLQFGRISHSNEYLSVHDSNSVSFIKSKNVVKTYKSSKKYTATFLDNFGNALKNTKVKLKLNHKTYTKKTNSKGHVSLDLDLKVGHYEVIAIHPNGYKTSSKIIVKHSITTENLHKRYRSSKHFKATFYDKKGKLLKHKYVTFKYRHYTIVKKTNSKGKAILKITTLVGTRKVITINPVTGEKVKNTIKVSPTLSAKKMTVFTGKTSKFKVKLYKNEKAAKHKKMHVYVDGAKKTVKTNSKGVATVKFKLSKGLYNFKSVDPYTGYALDRTVKVKLASIKAINMWAISNKSSTFQAKLLKQNGKVAKNTKMKITINGVEHKVKTNSKGFAKVKFKYPVGKYNVVCKDLKTGYTLKVKITVINDKIGVSYSKYGVSDDGLSILAIGRPSAPGEESKYGYTWYKTEFERTCPYCHGHNLYWDVFWSGDETTEVAIFPATGHREPGSTEGMIFCEDCDSDFSIFGKEHVTSNPMHLKVISDPSKSSKEEAYMLKSGNYVKI